MAAHLLLAGGMAIGTAALQFAQARDQYKLTQRQNAEARRVGDRQQALTSVNINRAEDQAVAQTIDINTARMQSRSQAIVAAAAAGTAGMSVDDSILDIERNAARAEANVLTSLNDSVFNLEESRSAIEAQVRSRTVLSPKPSVAAAALSAAMDFGGKTYGTEWDMASLGLGGA